MKTHWFPLIRRAINPLFLGGVALGGGTLDSLDNFSWCHPNELDFPASGQLVHKSGPTTFIFAMKKGARSCLGYIRGMQYYPVISGDYFNKPL